MRFLKNRESGQVLVIAVILLAVGSLLVVPTLNLASTNLNYHRTIEENTLETYAADSGVQYAICKLGNNQEAFGQEPLSSEVNGRTVNVAAELMGNNVYKITSVATSDSGSSTTIESYVEISNSLFEYVVASTEGEMKITGSALITSDPDGGDGDIYANGDIKLTGSATIDGDAVATGDIKITGSGSILGVQTPGFDPPLDFPSSGEIEDMALEYKTEAELGGIHSGDYTISGAGTYYLGPLHITGKLSISGTAHVILGGTVYVDDKIAISGFYQIVGPGTLISEGKVDLSGATGERLALENLPVIMSVNDKITISGSDEISAVLYAPNDIVHLTGSGGLYGAAIGQSVSITGSGPITYATGLTERTDLPGGGGLRIISWQISR